MRKKGVKMFSVICMVMAFGNDNLLAQCDTKLGAHNIVMYDSTMRVRYFIRIDQNGYLTDYSISDLSRDTSYKGYITNPQIFTLARTEDPCNFYSIGLDLDSSNITLDGNSWYANGNPFIQMGVVTTTPYTLRFYIYYEDFTLRMTGVLRRQVNNGAVTWKHVKTWLYYGTNGELKKRDVFEE